MKPIIRWTIGNVSNYGIDCLQASVSSFLKLYKNNFDYFICYNNLDFNKIKFLEKYNLNFLNQEEHKDSVCIEPISNPCWKLYPPRINLDVHEIFIDNDLIVYKKIPLIDKFLDSNKLFFITEAVKRSYSDNLNNFIHNKFNSGFFGVPPKFDFLKKINNIINKYEIVSWEHSIFEEQSVVAKIIEEENNFSVISLDEIHVCFEEIKNSKFGLHFVGLNYNPNASLFEMEPIIKFWKYYKYLFL